MIKIKPYTKAYQVEVAELVLDIQQNEFKVPITLKDQPDLQDVETFYGNGLSNFWIAVDHEKVVGTIALIDIGNRQVCLRKMFVHKEHRGGAKGVALLLLNKAIEWCREKGIGEIYLGTIDILTAAQKFYLKHGFMVVDKTSLPENFPLMLVDNLFFKLLVTG